MPELPEVEMVARNLRALVSGRQILRAQLLRASLAPAHTPAQFARLLKGARIVELGRRGKHILTHLDNDRTLITHLRMSGRFLYVEEGSEPIKHTHAIFHLSGKHQLLFTDQRHFARMNIVKRSELEKADALRDLGPEPLAPEFTPEYLRQNLARVRQPIKLALLDQTRVVGLGNIYVAEALHRARISPQMPAADLTPARARALHREIVAVLTEAIDAGSTLHTDPRQLDKTYTGGEFERSWRVYDREGEPCLKCKTTIERIVQGGRSTYYCPRCQANGNSASSSVV